MFTKKEILNEIKRTTEENNGIPLGEKRFRNETEIGPFEWGRYWPRWGDATQEAGFARNKPCTRYSDEFLIKKMIVKIREFEKYPTISELCIERYKDPNFPYHAIKKRGQEFIVRKIVDYCNKKTGHDDIIKYCKPILRRLDRQEKIDDTKTNKRIGEAYLFKSGFHYKIGHTYDSMRRVGEIGTQLAERPEQIHSIKTDDPSGVESYWHKRFEAKRIRGEWFKLNAQDVRAFKRWKKIY